jgi:hypothetical protein
VFACLLQIGTIAGTVERDFALLTAALGADPSVHGGTKSLFFPEIADRTAHVPIISRRLDEAIYLHHFRSILGEPINQRNRRHKPFLFVRLPATR